MWESIQNQLKEKLICENQISDKIKYIGGVDISFIKGDLINACSCLIVLDVESLEIVYEKCNLIKLVEPYIPGFLAFREVNHFVELIDELKNNQPELLPDVIFVDGNGILHHKGFGLACHLGVLTEIPTIGIGKSLLCIDGLCKKNIKQQFIKCKNAGDFVPLVGESKKIWGVAIKTKKIVTNPIYVSIGHKIDLQKSIELTLKYSKYRIPEPVRLADIISRKYLVKLALVKFYR